MGFTQNNTRSNASRSNNSAPAEPTENKIGGYLNVAVMGKDGTPRRLGQGGRGIPLREDHPVEGAVLKFLREQGADALASKLQLTFGDSAAIKDFEL